MPNTTFSATSFKPVAGGSLLMSLFMATPLFIFASALISVLRSKKR